MYLLEDEEGNIFSEAELYKLNTPPIVLPTNPYNCGGAIKKGED